jgi:hypothetical protein
MLTSSLSWPRELMASNGTHTGQVKFFSVERDYGFVLDRRTGAKIFFCRRLHG